MIVSNAGLLCSKFSQDSDGFVFFFHVHMFRALFSDITPEEFKNATITGYFWFVFEENFVRDIM